MNNQTQNNKITDQDIIASLSKLRSCKPSNRFISHVEMVLIPSIRKQSYLPNIMNAVSLRLAAIILLMLILSGGGLAYAAGKSTPGDILYPVKKAIEKVEMQFIRYPEKKTSTYLKQSGKSLENMDKKESNNNEAENTSIADDNRKNTDRTPIESNNTKQQSEDEKRDTRDRLRKEQKDLKPMITAVPTQAHSALEKTGAAVENGKSSGNKDSSSEEKESHLDPLPIDTDNIKSIQIEKAPGAQVEIQKETPAAKNTKSSESTSTNKNEDLPKQLDTKLPVSIFGD